MVVNGDEGEYAEYEVEADSYAKATAMAENLAADSMINISYIEVFPPRFMPMGGGKASIYDLRSIIGNYMEAKQLVHATCSFRM